MSELLTLLWIFFAGLFAGGLLYLALMGGGDLPR